MSPVVDIAVHPRPTDAGQIIEYMAEPLRRKPMPGVGRVLYPVPSAAAPTGEFLDLARATGATSLPGSDPAALVAQLEAENVDLAVLVPFTRGLIPSIEMMTAVCGATNLWLADRWLDEGRPVCAVRGSICVNPRDPEGAVGEIERWSSDPRMVQVVVPLQAHEPYGQKRYWPIWEAAAAQGLPVAVRADAGAGVEFHPTPVGYPRHYVEYFAWHPINACVHVASLIAEGVFERIPSLRVIFLDGGHDMLTQLVWTLDTTWPSCRAETPWVTRFPSEYITDHIRFCSSPLETPPLPADELERWATLTGAGRLLLFGSHFPHWSTVAPAGILPDLAEETRARVLGGNALEFYGARLDGGLASAGVV